jgi:hypothetical protein
MALRIATTRSNNTRSNDIVRPDIDGPDEARRCHEGRLYSDDCFTQKLC